MEALEDDGLPSLEGWLPILAIGCLAHGTQRGCLKPRVVPRGITLRLERQPLLEQRVDRVDEDGNLVTRRALWRVEYSAEAGDEGGSMGPWRVRLVRPRQSALGRVDAMRYLEECRAGVTS